MPRFTRTFGIVALLAPILWLNLYPQHRFLAYYQPKEGWGLQSSLSTTDLEDSDDVIDDPDATDCAALLEKFHADEIEVTKSTKEKDFRRATIAVARTKTPFYVSLNDKQIDSVRAGIADKKIYYETQLTKRIVELYESKRQQGINSIFLDVGANIGWFSLVAASHGATRVYSLEPNPQNVIRLCESIHLNQPIWQKQRSLNSGKHTPIVVPIVKGAGNTEEIKTMYAKAHQKHNPGSFAFRPPSNSNQTIVVGNMEITTLDAFAERHGWFTNKPNIGMFKLDAERFERFVLEGGAKLLRSNIIETIVLELQPDQSQEDTAKILELLVTSGYELYLDGNYKGPNAIVTKDYKNDWKDLLSDVRQKKYGVNVLFRLKGLPLPFSTTKTTSAESEEETMTYNATTTLQPEATKKKRRRRKNKKKSSAKAVG